MKHKKEKQAPLIVAIEGGLVTGVSSEDAHLIGRHVLVIDYDTDGADPQDLHSIHWRKTSCGQAGTAMAYVHGAEVVRTCLTMKTQEKLNNSYHE